MAIGKPFVESDKVGVKRSWRHRYDMQWRSLTEKCQDSLICSLLPVRRRVDNIKRSWQGWYFLDFYGERRMSCTERGSTHDEALEKRKCCRSCWLCCMWKYDNSESKKWGSSGRQRAGTSLHRMLLTDKKGVFACHLMVSCAQTNDWTIEIDSLENMAEKRAIDNKLY